MEINTKLYLDRHQIIPNWAGTHIEQTSKCYNMAQFMVN